MSNEITGLFQIKEEPVETYESYSMETDLTLLVFFAKNWENRYYFL